MDESFDWDSLTFSLTPTETMYLTTTTANDPWMPGDLRPYGHSHVPRCRRAQLRAGPL